MSDESQETKADSSASDEQKTVTGMSDRDIKWRAQYKATKSELETIRATSEQTKKALEAQIAETLKAKEVADSRRIESEVKAYAVSEGLSDLDLVKLMDMSTVKIDDKGDILGVKELVADFKAKKPIFFGAQKKTSTSTNAPTPEETKKESASAYDIPADEWKNLMRRAQSTSM